MQQYIYNIKGLSQHQLTLFVHDIELSCLSFRLLFLFSILIIIMFLFSPRDPIEFMNW